MATSAAYDKGYDACWDGVDVSDNPYDEETKERRSREEGWRSARKHDYDESERAVVSGMSGRVLR
ncbi:MAG: hypothetical protein WCB27_02390 [Thermoguttaceae bacterium]